MFFLNNALKSDRRMLKRADFSSLGKHWNLWMAQQYPYKELSEGARVIFVDSWPGGSRLTWETVAEVVVKRAYSSRGEAVRVIANALKLPTREVQDHNYTQGHPPAGYLLAVALKPIRKLNLQRPSGLRFQRNGWLSVENDAVLRRWGIGKPEVSATIRKNGPPDRNIAQGRLPIKQRIAVEKRAMDEAKKWCYDQGWLYVDDVSRRKSWDLEARKSKSSKPFFVEVKGTTGSATKVDVTAAEVRHANDNPKNTALIILTDIKLFDLSGEPRAKGGMLHAWHPWSPRKEELQPAVYKWKPLHT